MERDPNEQQHQYNQIKTTVEKAVSEVRSHVCIRVTQHIRDVTFPSGLEIILRHY